MSSTHYGRLTGYEQYEILPTAPYLALLGDIGQANDDRLFDFLRAQLPKFQTVFFLLGNHEPFESSWDFAKNKLRKFEKAVNTERRSAGSRAFVFLDQTRYDLTPEVTILGCTLNTHVPREEQDHVSTRLNDFRYINDWTVEKHNQAHSADVAWLDGQVTELASAHSERKVIIFTHHSPTFDQRTRDPAHTNSKRSSGFMSDLSREKCWTSPNVKIWAYGHTHFNCDFVDEDTGKRVVSNQRGYHRSQAKRFEPSKVISL